MARNLVICCDGTSNKFGNENTSVVRVVEVLKDDPNQLVFYDPGVGTLPGEMWRDKIRTAIDLALATGLVQNVTEAYAWLMNNWEPGDRIYVFGFSRGAYTARVLTALLHHIGLLPRGLDDLIPYAIRLLRSARKNDDSLAIGDEFRRTFARPSGEPDKRVTTHFTGVWDTVSSVGWVWDPIKYRFTATNPSAAIIRHAIAIDERRAFFRQNRAEKAKDNPAQDLQQYWFAGVHSDVGGGYPNTKIWRCSFDWLIAEAAKAGMLVDPVRLARTAPKIDDAWSQPTNESLVGVWKLAEFFPKLHWNGKRHDIRLNLFRRRKLREGELLHRSLLERINKTDYAPSNLSKAFISYVKTLREVPDVLAYAENPVPATMGLTPQTS